MRPDEVRQEYETGRYDAAVARGLDDLAQRLSRRGLLAKVGRVTLGVLGLTIATEAAPLIRSEADASSHCSGYELCGFCGWKCGCAACSGSLYQCPNCANIGGYWETCCISGGTQGQWIRYIDCCKGQCSDTKFNDCKCSWCCRKDHPVYSCGTYMCTKVSLTGRSC